MKFVVFSPKPLIYDLFTNEVKYDGSKFKPLITLFVISIYSYPYLEEVKLVV